VKEDVVPDINGYECLDRPVGAEPCWPSFCELRYVGLGLLDLKIIFMAVIRPRSLCTSSCLWGQYLLEVCQLSNFDPARIGEWLRRFAFLVNGAEGSFHVIE